VKEEPYKKKKFVRVTEKPLSKQAALERGFFVADETIAQSVRVLPTKQRIEKSLPLFSLSQKFRPRIIRGKLDPNVFVEKRGFAIDTFGEVRKLRVSRFLAEEKRANKLFDVSLTRSRKRKKRRY